MADRKNRTEKVVAAVEDMAEHFREGFREQVEGLDIGSSRVSDAVFATWFEMKTGRQPAAEGVEASPPIPWTHPDMALIPMLWPDPTSGMPVQIEASFVMSPWELDIHFAEGGKELLDRYQRAKQKEQGVSYGSSTY